MNEKLKFQKGDWVYYQSWLCKIDDIQEIDTKFAYVLKPHNSQITQIVPSELGDSYFKKA